ncbi:MAG TPA: FAD-dependent oxidoreductase [Streptosporangiaceae bacterium]|jgi:NADH dehydrogenase FAD-containing subunit
MTVPSSGAPTVVVIGGGYAGANVAKALDDVADVVLVEPKDAFQHNVAALRALADPAWLPQIFLPYGGLLARGRVAADRAVKVEPGSVTLASGEELAADYIVLATGSTYPFPAKSDHPAATVAHEQYRAAHDALAAADRVLLIGAGAVGIELAGEIKAAWPGKQVTLLDAADDILGARFRPDLKAELRRQLEALGVEVLASSPLRQPPPVPAGEPGEFTVVTESGREISADLWFRCYGVSPVSDYLAGELAVARGADGFVAVTPYLQVTGQERVFALGDVADADHKMAGIAGRQAQVVAANIKALIAGGELTAYEPNAPSIVVPVGPEGGSGQRAGADELLSAEFVSNAKGRDMFVGRYAELFGVPPAEAPAGNAGPAGR